MPWLVRRQRPNTTKPPKGLHEVCTCPLRQERPRDMYTCTKPQAVGWCVSVHSFSLGPHCSLFDVHVFDVHCGAFRHQHDGFLEKRAG